jgi:aminoglycoside 3-N-acetyltransferase
MARVTARDGPVTRESIATALGSLGVDRGMTVLVHASLSAIGWVAGGEQAVLEALRDAVGGDGTLVMPTQSWQLCDPAYLDDPAVPRAWWPVVREHLPPYDPAVTPTRTMGAVAELFRHLPGSLRSAHPHRSFTANGPLAQAIVARHDLDSPVGERSPLRALYEHRASILLLGVAHDKSTALHLAEDRCDYPGKHHVRNGGPLLRDGRREWIAWDELRVVDDDFEAVGAAFATATGSERRGMVGRAPARLIPMRELVDFAVGWFATHRAGQPDDP